METNKKIFYNGAEISCSIYGGEESNLYSGDGWISLHFGNHVDEIRINSPDPCVSAEEFEKQLIINAKEQIETLINSGKIIPKT